MRRQMTERETIWKDEAPPSTAMRNKKNIKRKKKLNTPKPSVLLCLVGRGGGLSVISPPPLSLSLSQQLVSLLFPLLFLLKARCHLLLRWAATFCPPSCQTWHCCCWCAGDSARGAKKHTSERAQSGARTTTLELRALALLPPPLERRWEESWRCSEGGREGEREMWSWVPL